MTQKDKRKLNNFFSAFANLKHLKIPETPEDLRNLPSYFPKFPISFVTISGQQVYHDDVGFKSYEEFVKLLLAEEEIARYYDSSSINLITKKHVTKYLEDFVQGSTTKGRIEQTIEDILAELSQIPDELEFHFLVNGLTLDDFESFTLGQATFTKIDANYAEKLFPDRAPADGDDKNDARREKRKSIIGRAAIRVAARGDFWLGQQKAYREAQVTVGALSLYPIIFMFESATPRLFRFTLSGLSRQEFGPVISYDTKTQQRRISFGGLSSLMPLKLTARDIERFKNYGWDDISTFLKGRSETNEIDQALGTSLFWLGQAAADTLTASILLKYFTAIETLIIGRRRSKTIVQDVARRVSLLVGATKEEQVTIRRNLTKSGGSYDVRSQITHAGLTEVEDRRKIFDTGALAAWTVLRYLKARGLPSLDEAIEKLDIAADGAGWKPWLKARTAMSRIAKLIKK